MQLKFSKYQGTGNDFILIDNRRGAMPLENESLVKNLCDRRLGIGADGLMLIDNIRGYDFKMRYFNSDGKEASMCGNGGRCIVAYAQKLGVIGNETKFAAFGGEYKAKIGKEGNSLIVSLKMRDVLDIEIGEDHYFLDTGSPHFVRFVPDVSSFDVCSEGRRVRFSEKFAKQGTNVNFVSMLDRGIAVRTYERGVEDETLSCGTGVVASSICASFKTGGNHFEAETKGGNLKVDFKKSGRKRFEDIWLTGLATHVFDGVVEV